MVCVLPGLVGLYGGGGGVCVSCTRLVFTHFLPCVMTECVRQVCLAKYT